MKIVPKLEKAVSNLYSLQVAPRKQDIELTFEAIHLIQEVIKEINELRGPNVKS